MKEGRDGNRVLEHELIVVSLVTCYTNAKKLYLVTPVFGFSFEIALFLDGDTFFLVISLRTTFPSFARLQSIFNLT